MTFEEIVNEVRPLAQKLLESKDEEMKGDALLLKSFIFLFVGMADQINGEHIKRDPPPQESHHYNRAWSKVLEILEKADANERPRKWPW